MTPLETRVEAILRLLDQLAVRIRPHQLLLEETNLPLEALDALHGVGIRGLGHSVQSARSSVTKLSLWDFAPVPSPTCGLISP